MKDSKSPLKLSIVTPMYNEEAVVDVFFERLHSSLKPVTENYEIICIDDGSCDTTLAKLRQHADGDSRIKIVSLSRNFGKEIALTAGLASSSGEAVVPIDSDLQDPPEIIEEMFKQWENGYEVVLAQREDRSSDSRIKRWTSKVFYKVIGKLADINIPYNVGDFRLLDRKAVECLNQYPERTRFMKGLFATLGFKEIIIKYSRPERVAGSTKWNYLMLYNLAFEGIISFSSSLLKIWSYIGITISVGAFIYGVLLIIKTLIYGTDIAGYASLMVVLLFMSGLILLSLGIIGEYLARIFIEVKARPLYIVSEKYGFEKTE